ncbi:F-box only protein 40 isoform X2 [Paroedura picta]
MCKEEEHRLLCPLEQVPCLNAFYGCPFTMARFRVAKHLQACPASIVCCSMEWNRWPAEGSERALHENVLEEKPGPEGLDVALALRDQEALFGTLKMAKLFPECKEPCAADEEDTDDDGYPGKGAAGKGAGPDEANDVPQLSQEERESLAKDKEGMDLAGYNVWENIFSKEMKACKVTASLAEERAKGQGSNAPSTGQAAPDSPQNEEPKAARGAGADGGPPLSPPPVNLAAERTGYAPWQEGVLERLRKEVPVGDYNMYLVHHGRMLIHFGQMAACTPKEKDFVYGNLEAQEVKTVTTFRVPVSYCGKRARLGDVMAHKKPTKTVSVDTSDLGVSPEDLPKSDIVQTTLLCALEKELKGHEISETKNTDALYVDFGTQTHSFAEGPFSSTAVLADVLEPEAPQSLHLQLHSESVTRRHNKSSSAFSFSCNRFFRRDEFQWHFKNVHADIQSCLDGWFQRRCPLAYLGCPFVQHPWCPAGQTSRIIYSQPLKTFAVKPQVHPALSETNQRNPPRDHRGKVTDALSNLPLEILQYIAGFLDSFSLSQLAQVSVLMRDVCATLLQERGMVFLLWGKKRYSHGGTSWRVRRKVWKFSSLFSAIKNWQFSDTPSMAAHLKTCAFYEAEHKTDPVQLTSMFSSEGLMQESLVSTFMRKSARKKLESRLR